MLRRGLGWRLRSRGGRHPFFLERGRFHRRFHTRSDKLRTGIQMRSLRRIPRRPGPACAGRGGLRARRAFFLGAASTATTGSTFGATAAAGFAPTTFAGLALHFSRSFTRSCPD